MTFEKADYVEIWDIMENTGEELLVGAIIKREGMSQFEFYPLDDVSMNFTDLTKISLKLQELNYVETTNAPTN